MGENPPYGMIGGIEETSASSKPDPRLDPTRLRGACDETHVPTATPPRIHLVLAAAATWPLAAWAQQSDRVRRVGLLQGLPADDPEWQRRFGAFKQVLQELGWSEGQNITFEARFADGQPERLASLAADLVRANVDVIVTNAAQPIEAARKATSTIPIVMASVGNAL